MKRWQFTVMFVAFVLMVAIFEPVALSAAPATNLSNAVDFGKKAKDLNIKPSFTYYSDSLKIEQGKFAYKNVECYINKIWMQSPGNQIKKVSNIQVNNDFSPVNKVDTDSNIKKAYSKANNTNTQTLIGKMTSTPIIAINCENIEKNDTLSVENGKIVLERIKYSDKEPKHNGISVNKNGVKPFFNVWREDIFNLEPSFTISAPNKYEDSVLVRDGKKVKSNKKTSKSARTVFGKTYSGEYFALTVGGKGLTIAELKDLCMKFDANWAINLSGGADTRLYTTNVKTQKLQKTYESKGSSIYSMLYITEYDNNFAAKSFSSNVADANYPPFESDYVKFTNTTTYSNPSSNKINPELGKRLEKVAIYLGATKKNPLVIHSGFRTSELQRRNWVREYATGKYTISWNGWLNRKSAKKDIIAPPGRSTHQTGNAVDIPYTGIAGKLRKLEKSSPNKLKNDFGLHRPIRHEAHHFELYGK